MTTANNRNVSLSHRKYGNSRVIRNVSPPSGKSEDLKQKGFLNRPRKGGKSFWDWMQLLIIPVILVTVGYIFSNQQAQTSLQVSQQQHDADQRQALDQQRATILQTYIDNIQDLLLNHNLRNPKTNDDVVILARARTLTALQGLDPGRKGHLLIFLYEARLIGSVYRAIGVYQSYNSIISLFEADLSDANLSSAGNFSGIDLNFAHLESANLSNDYLGDANLIGTYLMDANLSNTYLVEANLSDANLIGANLIGARYLTQQQLDQVKTCKNAILPPGLICHHNQP